MESNKEELSDLVEYGIRCMNKEGVEYADVKFIDTKMEDISFKNGSLERMSTMDKRGIGIRCLVAKSWGFASTNELTREKIKELAEKTIRIAKASSFVKKMDIELAEEPIYEDKVQTPIKKDPFEIELGEKIEVLEESVKRITDIRRNKNRTDNHLVWRWSGSNCNRSWRSAN
ncbi:MAG: PmbA/TldA family metallopeptidase [Candidatus Heimdallarchaeaceae archaeon]